MASKRYPNMDLLRYVLALAVVVEHTNFLAGGDVWFVMSSFDAVGGFFALSGFLMYPSYMRSGGLRRFLAQRMRRLLPPYLGVVLACALGLSLVSAAGAAAYFGSAGFWGYLGANLSFLNWLHPTLPGVFTEPWMATPAVNGSLWTMKVEWCLYLSVPLMVWLCTRLRTPHAGTAAAVAALSVGYRLVLQHMYEATGSEIYDILGRQVFGQLSYFYCGMLAYMLREPFVRHLRAVVVVSAAVYAALRLGGLTYGTVGTILNPPVLAALLLGISLWPSDPKWLRHGDNFSYSLYLCHYPVIQLGVLWGFTSWGQWGMLAWAVGASSLLAFANEKAAAVFFYKKRH